jgi:hypothetical protein
LTPYEFLDFGAGDIITKTLTTIRIFCETVRKLVRKLNLLIYKIVFRFLIFMIIFFNVNAYFKWMKCRQICRRCFSPICSQSFSESCKIPYLLTQKIECIQNRSTNLPNTSRCCIFSRKSNPPPSPAPRPAFPMPAIESPLRNKKNTVGA